MPPDELVNALCPHPAHRWEYLLVAFVFVVALMAPRLGDRWFAAIEAHARSFARRRWAPVLLLLFVPIALRVALLPSNPVPEPVVADEFTHLLIADTFTHGRLSNPPLAFPEHFETRFAIQRPTYSGAYPMGVAAMLAASKVLFGHPWVGVLLLSGIMPATIFWMLRSWTSPGWAFFASGLLVIQGTVLTYWTNSYWGGSLLATIGAVALAAIPRIVQTASVLWVVVLSFAVGAMLNIRPLETVLFTALVGVYLTWKLLSATPHRIPKFAAAALAGMLPWVVLMAVHNQSVTGNAATMPYASLQKEYGVPQPLVFQPAVAPAHPLSSYMLSEYEGQRERHDATGLARVPTILTSLSRLFTFYVGPVLLIPLMAALLFWRTSHAKLAFAVVGVVCGELLLYGFYFPHYAGAVTGLVFLIIAMGFARLRRWNFRGRPTGLAFSRLLAVACCVVFGGLYMLNGIRNYLPHALQVRSYLWERLYYNPHRLVYTQQLSAKAGPHIIFVRNEQWSPKQMVANDADPVSSPIIWVRSITPDADARVWNAYGRRTSWLIDCAEPNAALHPYSPATNQPESLDALLLKTHAVPRVAPAAGTRSRAAN